MSTDLWVDLQVLNAEGVSSTKTQVWFSKTLGPQRLLVWCFWLCHPRSQAPSEGTGLPTRLHTWRKTPLAGHCRYLIAQTSQLQEALYSNLASVFSYLIQRDTRRWEDVLKLAQWASQTPPDRGLSQPAPPAQLWYPRPSPRYIISQDVFKPLFLQGTFLLAENWAPTKLNKIICMPHGKHIPSSLSRENL